MKGLCRCQMKIVNRIVATSFTLKYYLNIFIVTNFELIELIFNMEISMNKLKNK